MPHLRLIHHQNEVATQEVIVPSGFLGAILFYSVDASACTIRILNSTGTVIIKFGADLDNPFSWNPAWPLDLRASGTEEERATMRENSNIPAGGAMITVTMSAAGDLLLYEYSG